MPFFKWITNTNANEQENGCKSITSRKVSRSNKKVGSLIKLSSTGNLKEETSLAVKRVTFNLIPSVFNVEDWDRSPCYLQDPSFVNTRTRRNEAKGPLLTPVTVYLIQQELNRFKTHEMLVHQDSLHMTRLHDNGCK